MNRLTPLLLCCVLSLSAFAEDLKPFYLASNAVVDFETIIQNVKKSLKNEGFEIVGEYAPYEGADVIIVTNNALQKAGIKGLKGSCKAGLLVATQRVSVTKKGRKVQVAFTDPVYMAAAYRVSVDLKKQRDKLAKALGKQKGFGSKGMSKSDLKDYHYTFGMEYCDDYIAVSNAGGFTSGQPLQTFSSYKDAVRTINRSLKTLSGSSKVFQVDMPEIKSSVFGISLTENDFSNEMKIMKVIDNNEYSHTAHLPYEIFVIGNAAYALHPRFRIAINFPDLTMAGDNSFMSITDAPDDIGRMLTMSVGREYEEESDDDEFW